MCSVFKSILILSTFSNKDGIFDAGFGEILLRCPLWAENVNLNLIHESHRSQPYRQRKISLEMLWDSLGLFSRWRCRVSVGCGHYFVVATSNLPDPCSPVIVLPSGLFVRGHATGEDRERGRGRRIPDTCTSCHVDLWCRLD